jgi:multimeric flavodoxin WrbA
VNILLLNGSPRKRAGATQKVIEWFAQGAKENGATIDERVVHDLGIKPCRGCFHCWYVTPGECIIEDTMAELLERFEWADMLVWATPVFNDSFPAEIKAVLDRTLPTAKPEFVERNGLIAHPSRLRKQPKAMLISVSGFPQIEAFHELSLTFKKICHEHDWEFAGEILCPAVQSGMGSPNQLTEMEAAVRKAGEEAAQGSLSPKTQEAVRKNYLDREVLTRGYHAFLKSKGLL